MDPPPPDPYKALGVEKDATLAQIKSAYRKLALKCHPDKVKDKEDEFQAISSAYELIGDEESRSKYDAEARLHQLREERKTRFQPEPEIRTAAYDFRSSPRPDFQFTARGPARYDSDERSSRTSHAPRSPPPRPSPYAYPGEADDYFGPRAQKRYQSPPPRRASTPRWASPVREEIRVKKEKVPDKSRAYESSKKTRDQARGNDRRAKRDSYYDDDASSDDSEASSVRYAPREKMQENIRRDAYVRRKARSADDEDVYEQRRRPETTRKSTAKEYIQRSRIPEDEPPTFTATFAERGKNRSREDVDSNPSPKTRSREDVTSSKSSKSRESRDSQSSGKNRSWEDVDKPSTRRKSEDRASLFSFGSSYKKKPSSNEKSKPSRPSLAREDSRRGASPERTPRKPTLSKHNSEPQNIKVPTSDKTDRRNDRASTTDNYREEIRIPPLRRSETAPSKSSPLSSSDRRRESGRESGSKAMPQSGLRNMETHDSGYSTSSPSEDTRPDVDREPSPPRRPTLNKEYSSRMRDGPPVSRSASYAMNNRSRDGDLPSSPSSARRPSLQRETSTRKTSTRDIRDDDQPRRGSLNRTDSGTPRTSTRSGRNPDLPRAQTQPAMKIRTDFDDRKQSSSYLYDDIPRTRSPGGFSDYSDHDSRSPRDSGRRDRDRDDRDKGSRRYDLRSNDRDRDRDYDRRDRDKSTKDKKAKDSGYGTLPRQAAPYSYTPVASSTRRASEDAERSRVKEAEQYMRSGRGGNGGYDRPGPQRRGTYAY